MSDPSLSRQSKDIILKHVAGVLGDGLFRRFGIGQAPIARRLPAELPVLEVRADYADLLYELTDDTIVDLELQSGSAPGDLERFADYSWGVWRRHRKRVHTVVLYGPRVTVAPPDRLDAGGHVFRLTNILLADQDGEAVLTRLKAKRGRREPFADEDLVDLVLAPLMGHRRPLIEVVPELLPLVDALPSPARRETMGTIVGLAYHYFEAPIAASLLEVLKMSNVLEELIASGIVKGREEGREEEKRASLRTLLRLRFGVIPPALDRRIETATMPALDALFAMAATADRIDSL